MTEFGDVSHLLPPSWKSIVTTWFQEDCPSFDYGGLVVGETPEIATLYGKSKVRNSIVEPCLIGCLGNIGRSTIFRRGIFATWLFVNPSNFLLTCRVEWHMKEGIEFSPIAKIATVAGPARKILLGERVALNTLARCSGIATKYVFVIKLC